ncbi:ribosomal protection-like ABC-F family protein [Ignavigranum ruoffiae]|uniref:ribosomal protection-like ABC-F family protein n=1 Tax=Ignavigranum ruoffiae TaxID=89093 RepID=UPI0024ACA1DE|nr:ABC-F family ATP-binding cassette domain-containing protein [Ignavigranum ruoffiae]
MINIQQLNKTIGVRNLLHVEALSIEATDKIGLIGQNGVGKSTLLRILAGLDQEYSGQIDIQMSLSYLFSDDQLGVESGQDQDTSIEQTDLLKQGSPGQVQSQRLAQVLDHPDSFLLLDEPTSHLDLEQKDLLSQRLQARTMGYLAISHDRDFINQNCHKIFELSQGSIEIYNGNYEFYLDEKIKREKFTQREYQQFVKEKQRLKKLAQEVRQQSAAVRRTPKRMGNSEARLHKMGGQSVKKKLDNKVKAIETRMQQLDVKAKPKEDSVIRLSLPEGEAIQAKVLVSAESLNKSYQDKKIFRQAKFTIERGDRIALIGPNGSGKTTLLKMILSRKQVQTHPRLQIGYYSQMEENLDLESSILENILISSIFDETLTRIVLARLGFTGDSIYKRVAVLSDGEQAKIKLAKLITSKANLIMLDEPTNYLDIQAIEVLEELLLHMDRPLIFVSHDVSLINHLANKLFLIKHQQIETFAGNLQDYQQDQLTKKQAKSDQQMLIDFRLTQLNSLLSLDLPADEKARLEEEYLDLLNQKHNRN